MTIAATTTTAAAQQHHATTRIHRQSPLSPSRRRRHVQVWRSLATMAIAIAAISLAPLSTEAHGLMCTPRQRGAYKSVKCHSDLPFPADAIIDHCAHCLNAGTVATVSANMPASGWHVYDPINDFDRSATRAGLCGDPVSHNEHMIGGSFLPLSYGTVPIVAHWKTGGAIDFVAQIDTSHNGYFEFFICDLDKCKSDDISAKCFKNGHCHLLQRVKHDDCEHPSSKTHYVCGPKDVHYPGRWYLPCRDQRQGATHIVGGEDGTMRYKLPQGLECKHCVVQWYWATANSCAPRGLLDYKHNYNSPFGETCDCDGGASGTFRDGMQQCGGQFVPEEFWSCADVQVTPNGKSAGPVKAVAEDIPAVTQAEQQGGEEANGNGAEMDPRQAAQEAQEEVRKDIALLAHEMSGERKKRERRSADGGCLLEMENCDGNVKCCHYAQVCVFRKAHSGFRCTFWWSLWEEAESNDKI